MKPYRAIALLAAVSLGCFRPAAAQPDTEPPAVPAEEQPEVLSRGPVHEAFAVPVTMHLQEGLVVPQPPPPDIEEVPSGEKPQGQQFVWIPGYWFRDTDRNDYIWISGCWRAAPPERSWMPGYWAEVPGGWQWISGFWAPAGLQQLEYLPVPPTIERIDPAGRQPSPDTIWVPPCMYWSNGRYVRRAGYWLKAQPNWVWVPSRYVITPRGCLFADGYWDYAMDRRGVLFAPVYFPAPVHRRVAVSYSPGIVINISLLRNSLFVYPRFCHYYFGDYYDTVYLSRGIYPWFESRRYRTWYDPVYEHDRWRHHRSDPHWEQRRRDDYRRRCDDRNLRPAHTFREQESRLAGTPERQRGTSRVVQPIDRAIASRKLPMKFERINTDTRQKLTRQAAAIHTYSRDRSRWESRTAIPKTTPSPAGARKLTVTPSAERTQTVQPSRESKSVEPAKTRKSNKTATEADLQRKSTFTPPRETQMSQPDRTPIPASPVTGRSGKQGVFHKGPPRHPAGESKNDMDTDVRRK
jgi:hypothetical protein